MPDHELSCQVPQHRALMQAAAPPWSEWFHGTEEWYRYEVASPEQRAQMAAPELRDPSQFTVESFFEVDARTGLNRYGLLPTCVTMVYKNDKRDLTKPIEYKWTTGKEPTMEQIQIFNAETVCVQLFCACIQSACEGCGGFRPQS